jgi:transposase-like protein
MTTLQQTGPVPILTGWASSMGAFRRNKLPSAKKVIAAALCNAGYSYRDVAAMVGGLSYIAARDAYLAMLTSLPDESKRFRREVAIDGVEVNLEGRSFYLWLARDVDAGEIMAFHASPGPSAEDGARFLVAVAAQCANKPLLRLGTGPNNPRGLINLDLYFQPTSPPSIIGRIGRLFLGSG